MAPRRDRCRFSQGEAIEGCISIRTAQHESYAWKLILIN